MVEDLFRHSFTSAMDLENYTRGSPEVAQELHVQARQSQLREEAGTYVSFNPFVFWFSSNK